MAIKVLKTSSTLTGSAGLYETIESHNFNARFLLSTGNYIATSTLRTISATFAHAANQTGIIFHVMNCTTGTLTVVLKEDGVQRTSDSFTLSTEVGDNFSGPHYFALSSYAVTTDVGKWTYEISCTSGTPQFLVTTGTTLWYLASTDYSSAIIQASDTLVLGNDVTMTFDSSFTLAATSGVYIMQCDGSKFEWENPPVASYTLTFSGSGTVWLASNCQFIVGTEALPIPVAQRAIIDATASNGYFIYGYWTSNGTTGYSMVLSLVGAEDTKIGARLSAEADSGQAHIITVENMGSDWAIGDHLSIIGKKTTNETTTYTISNISGTDITLNTNLNVAALKGAGVVNLDRKDECGVWFTGATATKTYLTEGYGFDHIKIIGAYLKSASPTANYYYVYPRNLLGYVTIRNVILDDNGYANHWLAIRNCDNATFDGIYIYSTSGANVGMFYINGNNNFIRNIFIKNMYGNSGSSLTGPAFSGTDNTISNIVVANTSASATQHSLYIDSVYGTITDIFNYHNCGLGLYCPSLTGSTIDGLDLSGATAYHLYLAGTTVACTIKNARLGMNAIATTAEIYAETNTVQNIIFSDADIGTSATIVSNISNAVTGSYIRFHNYDITANDHRSWYKYGYMVSTGDGLTDTTVHTSGTGKFALRYEPTSSTNNLTLSYDVPTGDISGDDYGVGIRCKINSATFWAGTHQLPRLTVSDDNGVLGYCQAAQTTDWQNLPVPFVTSAGAGKIILTLSARTDATGSNAYVYWDKWGGGNLVNGGMDLWSDALPLAPVWSFLMSANDMLEALTTVDYGTDSIGELLKSISSDVWEETRAGHVVAGTMGEAMTFMRKIIGWLRGVL